MCNRVLDTVYVELDETSDSSVSLCNYDGLEVSIWVFGSPVTLVGTLPPRLSLPGGASVSLALELIPAVHSSLTNLIPLLRNPSVSVPEFPGGGSDRHAVLIMFLDYCLSVRRLMPEGQQSSSNSLFQTALILP